MLLTHSIALPLLKKTEVNFSRQQEDAKNSNAEYKLNRMMTIPNGFHKEVREGKFDIQQTGLLVKKLTLVPNSMESEDSYLLLQVLNNRVYGLDMQRHKIMQSNNIKFITSGQQPKLGSDHFCKNSNIGTNFLFRLEQFNEDFPSLIFWFSFATDVLGLENKTSVLVELEPYWFTSHAFNSNGERCCHFRHNYYHLDPTAQFTKSCSSAEIALEYAKVNPFPMVKGDVLEVIKKPNGKFI
jgi:hypothetical protein